MSLLTNKPAKTIVCQFKGPVQEVLLPKENIMKQWEESDGDPGYIVGSAAHFIPWRDINNEEDEEKLVEQFIVTGPWPHDYLIQHLRGEGITIGVSNDERTEYGFLTTNGFFVDRVQACKIWREMLKISEWTDLSFVDNPNKGALYSYDYKPEVIDACYELVKGKTTV